MKAPKARKSTHGKGKVSKTIRSAGKKILTPAREGANKEWEIDELGPVYLMWGKKKVRHDKTKKPMKKYYVKSAEKHYIWVKWKNPFQDKPDIVWSAEPQENFTSPELKKQIEIKLSSKHIWPFPSASDGRDSGYEERTSICKKLGYQLWQSSRMSEQAQTWRLLNGIEPTTGSSDGSTSEASNSESEAPEEDEEEDEV
jgi:hypothetical protein